MQLVLIPAVSQINSIYASSSEGVRNLLELCIPREVAVLAEPCIDVTFNLSVEFYRQVFGEDVNASKSHMLQQVVIGRRQCLAIRCGAYRETLTVCACTMRTP